MAHTWAEIATLHFSCYLQMGPISSAITLQKAGKVCQGQKLRLNDPICKLQRKLIVVNTALAS